MSIFQKSVINNHLSQLDSEQVEKAFEKFNENYSFSKIAEIQKMKEEEYQDGFLRDIFVNVLGYTLKPDENYNLQREYKNQTDGKKADGAILKNDNAVAVIELKSTKTKDLTSVTQQAFNYKNNQPECKYVITSNFQKLRFYIDYANEYEEFDLFNLQKSDFQLFYLLLHKDSILSDLPLKLKTETKFHEENISDKLYKDYSSFKYKIYNNLVKNNPQYDKLTLFKKSQKFLDRLLFVFFAEDTGLVPPNAISKIVDQWIQFQDLDEYVTLYSRFVKFFGHLDKGHKYKTYDLPAYNGGLFASDEILDNITIDDEVLKDDALLLSAYDYSTEVDVNILGHIFEHSLNEIEEITSEIEGTATDKSKTKRKKDGVFYTPKYITQYIVENTIGKLCTEKRQELDILEIEFDDSITNKSGKISVKGKKLFDTLQTYKDWLFNLKIVDPACGSGAFLNQALNFLINEHQQIDDIIAELTGESLRLFDTDKTILEKNLYGVDINEESVEIAKLSLWLRTAQKGRKLSNLNNNIKCGNSLIDDPEVAGEKAFNWQNEFPEILANGGFDVVIGNPPYVDIKGLDDSIVRYIFKTYSSANNRVNLYSTFIEKSISILKNSGNFSFIIPSSLLTLISYKELRQLILEECSISNIVRLPNESFGGAAGEVKVDTIILTFKKGFFENTKANIFIYKGFNRIAEITNFNTDIFFQINPFIWKNENDYIFRINVKPIESAIILKCKKATLPLIECGDFCLGITPYDKYKGHSQEQIKQRAFHANYRKDDTYKKLLAGNDIRRYYVMWGGEEWISYGDWLGAAREKRFFNSKRILVKQIIDWSDKRIWAALTEEELYNTQNAFNIIPKENFCAEYLIALINSNLISFYHRKEFLEEFKDRFQKILIKEAKVFPIKTISLQEQEVYVKKVGNIKTSISDFHSVVKKFLNRIKSNLEIEKISTKLEKFYDYDFKTFVAELKKQKVKLSLVQQDEWEEYFNAYKTEINTLQSQISATDKAIDQMVYELYGLTEEEIKIVENSIK